MKLPTTLWHVALESQSSWANSHSFISESFVPEEVGDEVNKYTIKKRLDLQNVSQIFQVCNECRVTLVQAVGIGFSYLYKMFHFPQSLHYRYT